MPVTNIKNMVAGIIIDFYNNNNAIFKKGLSFA